MFDNIEPAFLTKDQARQELEFLAKRLAELDNAYYQDDAPLLTDMEYDRLKKRNEQIEALFPDLVLQNTPSKKVGAKPQEGFSKIEHRKPMLSLSNIFEEEEITDFTDKVRRFLGLSFENMIDFDLCFINGHYKFSLYIDNFLF